MLLKVCVTVLTLTLGAASLEAAEHAADTFDTGQGKLRITFVGHGTLMFEFAGKVIHVDPVGRYGDYSSLPKGDLILITHEHGDHFDPEALAQARKPGAPVIANAAVAARVEGAKAMANGDKTEVLGLTIQAVPAYNIQHKREDGQPFHTKGNGNGYVITFGDKRVYIAGDTEDIPEMKNLKGVDIAFLPVNLPYTMTVEMAANAARMLQPRVLYPYHYGNTEIGQLKTLLAADKNIQVRVRDLR